MAKHNRFTSNLGKATFKCAVCGRMTRDTGQDVRNICYEDYEIAGFDNTVNDNGLKPGDGDFDSYHNTVNGLLIKIHKLGGDAQKTVEANGYLFQDGHGFTIPGVATVMNVLGISPKTQQMIRQASHHFNSADITAVMKENAPGTITIRKARGKKHRFLMGGPSLKDAVKYVNWDGIKDNELVFWTSHDGGKPIQVLNTLEGKSKLKKQDVLKRNDTFDDVLARYENAARLHWHVVSVGKLEQASPLVEQLKVFIAEIEAVNS